MSEQDKIFPGDVKPEAIKAFVKAQMEMGNATKNGENPHFGKKYADLESVKSACVPALNRNGFAVMQVNHFNELGEHVDTIFMHESGAIFSTRVKLRIGKADMQGYGSAMTYARRYGLMNLAGIAPEDDDGNAAAKTPPDHSRDYTPPNDHEAEAKAEAAVQELLGQIGATDTIEQLGNLWKAYARTPAAADPRAVQAKDSRKAELKNSNDEAA